MLGASASMEKHSSVLYYLDGMYQLKEIYLGAHIWGHAYEYDLDESISSELEAFSLLDQICADHQLEQLGNLWNPIAVETARSMMGKGLRFDIAYNSPHSFEPGEVEAIEKRLFDRLDWSKTILTYTNCFGDPWAESSGFSWNPLTQQTFDVAIVVVEPQRLFLIYFMSED